MVKHTFRFSMENILYWLEWMWHFEYITNKNANEDKNGTNAQMLKSPNKAHYRRGAKKSDEYQMKISSLIHKSPAA